VCYFGTYRKEYARNKIIIAALEKSGNEVVQCHAKLWYGIQDRIDTVQGGWRKPKFWWRVLKTYLKLIWSFRNVGDFDILMVGYPGQFDVFLAKLLAILKGKPLVWDVFMSVFLIASERGLKKDHRLILSLIRWVEYTGLRLPDMLIQDTKEYVLWFENEYKISRRHFRLVPTGADDRIFKPSIAFIKKQSNNFLVLYYGSFIPNHGVMKIAEAIKLLETRNDISFQFIGEGPEKLALQTYIQEHNIENVEIFGWMSQNNLVEQIAKADICLGVFGKTPQSLMTVQNKIYECLAMGKPIITGDSLAIRNALPPHTVVLCERSNPNDISNAIIELKNNPEKRRLLSKNAEIIFNNNYNIEKLGEKITDHLSELISSPNNHGK